MGKYEEQIDKLEGVQEDLIDEMVLLTPGCKERIRLHNTIHLISSVIDKLKDINQ